MLDRVHSHRFLVLAAAITLGACAGSPRPDAGETQSPPAPTAAARLHYEIVESDITVQVYRDGPLARLGHNHVIASTAVTGRIELGEPVSASTLELALPLDSLTVDEPARRLAAGSDFPGDLTDAEREGTRRNMLGSGLLDAARFPVMRLTSVAVEEREGILYVTTRMEVAGDVRELVVPAVVDVRDGALVARGEFTVTHADLGLAPFSVALGALRVREDLRVAFRLVARRAHT